MLLSLLATGALGFATGIFFLLFCLEQPVYQLFSASRKNGTDNRAVQVALVLQQFIKFSAPKVMAALIVICVLAIIGQFICCGISWLQWLVMALCILVIGVFGVLIPPATKAVLGIQPSESASEIEKKLMPLVRLHCNGAVITSIAFVLQLLTPFVG